MRKSTYKSGLQTSAQKFRDTFMSDSDKVIHQISNYILHQIGHDTSDENWIFADNRIFNCVFLRKCNRVGCDLTFVIKKERDFNNTTKCKFTLFALVPPKYRTFDIFNISLETELQNYDLIKDKIFKLIQDNKKSLLEINNLAYCVKFKNVL
jgi:hypothetical protein